MAVWNQTRSFWTWGNVSDEPDEAERRKMAQRMSEQLGQEITPPPIPDLDKVELRASRIEVPGDLSDFVSSSSSQRALHTYGGHVLELLKALRGQFDNPPDAVAHPRNEDELEAALSWCDRNGYTAIPYGGATSVVWGLNVPEQCEHAVTIDMDHFNRVLEVDDVSRAACVEAGVFGPDLSKLDAKKKTADHVLRSIQSAIERKKTSPRKASGSEAQLESEARFDFRHREE